MILFVEVVGLEVRSMVFGRVQDRIEDWMGYFLGHFAIKFDLAWVPITSKVLWQAEGFPFLADGEA